MSKGFKLEMLITSFLPLWISIVFIDIWKIVEKTIESWNVETNILKNISEILKSNIVPIIFVILIAFICVLSCILLSRFLKSLKKGNNSNGKVANIRKNSNLSVEFLTAYILPMLVFDFTSLLDILLFILYFGTIAFLCIRNNYVYVNIFLEFKGYKLYTGDVECLIINKTLKRSDCLIISKNDLASVNGEEIVYYDFDKKIYIDLTEE